MPNLKQLSCQMEWANTGTSFQEYGTVYGDGVVETFIVIPSQPQIFSIHLVSKGFVYEGLSVMVFVDGEYQCNRNRLNLKPYKKGKPKNRTEVDFRLRQKEKSLGDGTFIGREWRFDRHGIVSAAPPEAHAGHFDSLGNIEILVRRCSAASSFDDTQSTSSGADYDPLDVNSGVIQGQDDGRKQEEPASDGSGNNEDSGVSFVSFGGDATNDQPGPTHGSGDGFAEEYWGWLPRPPGMHPREQLWPGYSQFQQPPLGWAQGPGRRQPTGGQEKRVHFDDGGIPNSKAPPFQSQQGPNHTAMHQRQGIPHGCPTYTPAFPFNGVPPHPTGNNMSGYDGFGPGGWMHQSMPYGYDIRALHYRPGYPSPYYTQGLGYMWNRPNPNHNRADQNDTTDNSKDEENKDDGWGATGSSNDNKKRGSGWGGDDNPNYVNGWVDENNNANNKYGTDVAPAWGDEKNSTNDNNGNAGATGWGETQNQGDSSNQQSKEKAGSSWDNNDQNNDQQNDNAAWPNGSKNSQQGDNSWPAAQSPEQNVPGAWVNTSNVHPANNTRQIGVPDQPVKLYGPHGPYFMPKDSAAMAVPVESEEEPRYDVPATHVDITGSTHQVQPGRGYKYWHKLSAPEYIDTVEEPYARFVFKYRTKEQIECEIGIKVDVEPSGDTEIQELQTKDKQEIINMLLRAKSALGGRLPSPRQQSTILREEEFADIQPVPVPPPNRSFLKYNIPHRNISNISGLGIASAGGGRGSWQAPPAPAQQAQNISDDWGGTSNKVNDNLRGNQQNNGNRNNWGNAPSNSAPPAQAPQQAAQPNSWRASGADNWSNSKDNNNTGAPQQFGSFGNPGGRPASPTGQPMGNTMSPPKSGWGGCGRYEPTAQNGCDEWGNGSRAEEPSGGTGGW